MCHCVDVGIFNSTKKLTIRLIFLKNSSSHFINSCFKVSILSHFLKVLVLSTFIYCTKIWGVDLKNSHWKVCVKGTKMHMMSHIIVCCSTTIIFCGPNLDISSLNTIIFFSGPS